MINFTKGLLILFVFALELQVDLFFEYISPFSYSSLALRTAGIALARLQDKLAAFRTSASSKIFIFFSLGHNLGKPHLLAPVLTWLGLCFLSWMEKCSVKI